MDKEANIFFGGILSDIDIKSFWGKGINIFSSETGELAFNLEKQLQLGSIDLHFRHEYSKIRLSKNEVLTYEMLKQHDYTKPSGTYVRRFIGQSREAPAVFKRNGHYYMLSSGCTGWDPNKAKWAVSDSMLGVWELKDNPCLGRDADKTFYAQSTYVLPIEGMQDRFIAMFDRWNKTDLINSRYVWLPVEFDGDKPLIRWADQWDIQTMETIY